MSISIQFTHVPQYIRTAFHMFTTEKLHLGWPSAWAPWKGICNCFQCCAFENWCVFISSRVQKWNWAERQPRQRILQGIYYTPKLRWHFNRRINRKTKHKRTWDLIIEERHTICPNSANTSSSLWGLWWNRCKCLSVFWFSLVSRVHFLYSK